MLPDFRWLAVCFTLTHKLKKSFVHGRKQVTLRKKKIKGRAAIRAQMSPKRERHNDRLEIERRPRRRRRRPKVPRGEPSAKCPTADGQQVCPPTEGRIGQNEKISQGHSEHVHIRIALAAAGRKWICDHHPCCPWKLERARPVYVALLTVHQHH